MKVTIQKLGITIDAEEVASAAAGAPLPSCFKGYAVYAFQGTRTLRRVGGATCQFPHPGSTASHAGSTLMVASTLSSQMSNMIGSHTSIRELRFAVCCPPPAEGIA